MNQSRSVEYLEKLETIKTHTKTLVGLTKETRTLTTHDDGDYGAITITEGLAEVLGFELVSFGVSDPDDLKSSAIMQYNDYPGCAAIDIPTTLLLQIFPESESRMVQYKQSVFDESTLDDNSDESVKDACWIPDGGYPLIPLDEFIKMTPEFDKVRNEKVRNEKARTELVNELCNNFRDKIKQYGFAKVGVFDKTGNSVNFAYTVGLTLKGLPEIITSARFDIASLSMIFDHFAEKLIEKDIGPHYQHDAFSIEQDLEGRSHATLYDVRLVEVDCNVAVQEYLLQAKSIMEMDVSRVMWAQISDSNKLFYGDVGFINEFEQPEIAPII
jgi:Domain of unknown function (DUF4262)